MRIGELGGKAGVSTRALRYYEEHGLLRPERTGSGQRIYPDSAVDRVRLIQQFYAAGLSSRLIERLLAGIDARHLDPALLERLAQERTRIADEVAALQEAGRRLDQLLDIAVHPKESCRAADLEPLTPSTGRTRRSLRQ
ncbi:MerR family transcriptional regulator [Kribbella sp. NPDC004875]|uniref:MerR family transcriptional regulator n=1 Tax=Kribbella sp. NPDC004875 TaxID=3364107 RepID=UPI0036CC209F